ncbi:hypothetical protein PMAYCL1PPCAC_17134, partial [Pristionchus mayeri]
QTLNIQLSLTTFFGIGCFVFMLQFMGITHHPVTEVLICPVSEKRAILRIPNKYHYLSILPAIAPVFNLLCIRPYRLFIFTVLVSCLGVTANSILLVAIKTRSSPSFRVYSTILLNNAAVDLIASLFAAFTITRIASSHETFTTFLIFTGPCSYVGRLPCWIIHAIEVQMWITSNYFLCFAFAYRLMSIRKAPLLLIRVISIAFFIHVFNCLTATALFSLFLE